MQNYKRSRDTDSDIEDEGWTLSDGEDNGETFPKLTSSFLQDRNDTYEQEQTRKNKN
jgi:hypothetical protein